MEYSHILCEDASEIKVGGGCYSGEEKTLQYGGREVLYSVGGTTAVACCCGGGGGTAFVTVHGFVTAWQHRKDEDGVPISEVEPVVEEEARIGIRAMIEGLYGIRNVRFW